MKYDIRELPLFAGIGEWIVEPLQKKCSFSSADPGQTIVCQGDADTGVYFVMAGEARKERVSEEGTIIALGIVKKGEFFGEEFAGEVAYDVVAIDKCIIVKMPNDAFDLALECPRILARVCDKMAQSMRRAYDRLTAGSRIESRIIAALREYGEPMFIRNHSVLAALIGQTRENVCRRLPGMEEKGILKRTFLKSRKEGFQILELVQ